MISWFHRFHGVNGFIVSRVSWFYRFRYVNGFLVSQFHRFRGVNGFMVSQVLWCRWFHGFIGFLEYEVSRFYRSLGVKQLSGRRPLGFVRHAFISPPRRSAKHSQHFRSSITGCLQIFVKRNPRRLLRFARSVRLLIGCARNL